MHNPHNIEEKLDKEMPALTSGERDALWRAIEHKLVRETPVPSPFIMFNFQHRKIMTTLLLIVALVLGGGSTALASDAARPGDLLFPLERALENARLRLTTDESARTLLKERLADERLKELEDILGEHRVDDRRNGTDDSASFAGANASTTEIEADVFTDITIVKIEQNDRKTYFETDARTRDAVVAFIVTKTGFSSTTVDALLDFEIENRASRSKDRGVRLSDDGEVRVGQAVDAILSFLEESGIEDRERALLLEQIFSAIEDLRLERDDDRSNSTDRFRVREDEDGDTKIEIRDNGERIRIEEKNGEIRIRTSREDSDDDGDDSDDSDDSSNDDSESGSFEAEADIFTNTTIVKIEQNDRKTYFETGARTRDSIVTEIVRRFDVDRTLVESVLEIEVEDRASRADDQGDDEDSSNEDEDSDDDSDDNSDDDRDDDDSSGSGRDDDDEDDDNSGHGSGDDDEDEDDDDNSGSGSDDDDEDDD